MKDADDVLGGMAAKSGGRIGIREVLTCVMSEFGGPEGFAHEVFLDFEANNVGSANRIRIESDILRAIQNYGEPDDDDDDLGALEATAKQLLEQSQDDGDD